MKKEIGQYLKKVLPPTEWNSLSYPIPYILRFENKSSALWYLGIDHTNEVGGLAHTLLKKEFYRFIERYPDCSIGIEHFVPPIESTEKHAIEKYGEMGLLAFWANKEHKECFALEYSHLELLHDLKEEFDSRDIAATILLNLVHNIKRSGDINLRRTQIEKGLAFVIKEFQIESLENIATHIHKTVGHFVIPITIDLLLEQYTALDFEFIKKLQSPYSSETIFNIIAERMNLSQDQKIAHLLLERLERGAKIFAVMGHNHVIAQEPALRLFFE